MPLLDVDPDLGALVPDDRREAARRELKVEVHQLPQGPWSAGSVANPQHVGLLLLDGVIAREVVVSDTVSTELLGPGDVVRPWSIHPSAPLLQLTVRWIALTESKVAVLDRRFGTYLGQWPEVNAALIDRLNDRAQRLATTQAISQLNRVDRRLLSLFWHLAERWGHVTSGGVAIPLTLSHRMLGQLVGARRPTVSTAIADLAARQELVRRDDGSWLLMGEPVGVPTAEAERLIPIRRKLMGRLGAEDNGAPEPWDAAAFSGANHELRETLDRLCAEARVQIDQLTAIADVSRRLTQEAVARREQRKRDARPQR